MLNLLMFKNHTRTIILSMSDLDCKCNINLFDLIAFLHFFKVYKHDALTRSSMYFKSAL